MKFSTVAILSAVAGSSVASWVNGTVTDIATTVVTITSCEENKCHETAVTTGLTTVTELETTYTTYCPLSSEESAKPSSSAGPSTVEAESSSAAPSSAAPSVTAAEAGAANIAAPVAAGLLALGALL